MKNEDETVLTPAGPRPRSQVHAVEPGRAVRRTRKGTYVLVAGSRRRGGTELADEELVLTPGGLRPRSVVHRIEPGTILDGREGRYRQLDRKRKAVAEFGHVPFRPVGRPLMPRNVFFPVAPVPAFGTGWITYASWSNTTGTPVSRFATSWVVPPAAVHPVRTDDLPVQRHPELHDDLPARAPVGAIRSRWRKQLGVASWYADGQCGQLVLLLPGQVNAGDVLIGVMTLTGQSAQRLSYNCEFQGIANTSLAVQNIQELTWCIETLEAYGITKCSDYPNTDKTAMAAIDLRTGNTQPTVVWTVTDSVTDCGQHTLRFDDDAVGHGEVDLWYRGGPFWTAGAGTIAPGETQQWWFSWGGVGDVGPQLIQAEPLNASAKLTTTEVSETVDGNGHMTYFATVRNDGPNAVGFQWRGGGR